MKKIIAFFVLICVACVIGISVALFVSRDSSVGVSKDYEMEKLACNIIDKPCEVEFRAKKDSTNSTNYTANSTKSQDSAKITFDISPRPVIVMEKSTIRISNLHYDFYDPKMRIFGLNMEMGTIITSLEEVENGVYEGKVALSACLIENVMRYRIAVYDANEPTGLYIDFDLER